MRYRRSTPSFLTLLFDVRRLRAALVLPEEHLAGGRVDRRAGELDGERARGKAFIEHVLYAETCVSNSSQFAQDFSVFALKISDPPK